MAARYICGSGSPNGSSTSSVRPAWPGAPWMTWYARRSARRSDGVPTCTRSRRSPGCSTSATGCSDRAGGRPQRPLGRRRRRCGSARCASGARARIGARSMLCPGSAIGDDAEVAPGSAVFGDRAGRGVLVRCAGVAGPRHRPRPLVRAAGQTRVPGSRRTPSSAVADRPRCRSLAIAAGGALALAGAGVADRADVADLTGALLPVAGAGGPWSACSCWRCCVLGVVRLRERRAWRPGAYPVRSRVGPGRCGRPSGSSTRPAPGSSRSTPALLTPTWLRLLGARIGADVEASTVLMIPSLTTVNDDAFLADDTLHRRVRARRRLAADRAGQDREARLRRQLRAWPRPAARCPSGRWSRCSRPRPAQDGEGRDVLARQPAGAAAADGRGGRRRAHLRPADPAPRRPCAWEACRLLPVLVTVALHAAVVLVALAVLDATDPVVAGCAACSSSGRRSASPGWSRLSSRSSPSGCWSAGCVPGDHPLWSSFVWRNELADTFVEVVAAPWFARAVTGTPLLTVWFRLLGLDRRPRRLVRDLLAAGGRPRRARRRRHRQPGQRGPDPPVPRPDAEHRRGPARSRRDPRSELGDPARRRASGGTLRSGQCHW